MPSRSKVIIRIGFLIWLLAIPWLAGGCAAPSTADSTTLTSSANPEPNHPAESVADALTVASANTANLAVCRREPAMGSRDDR